MLTTKPANQALDLSGKQFGRWMVLHPASRKGKFIYWKVQCSCGVSKEVRGSALVQGKSESCGCLSRELTSARQKSLSKGNPARKRGTLEYFKTNTWNNLKQRAVNYNPNPRNKSYIKKGIELRISKEEFYTWCDSQSHLIKDIHDQGKTPSIDRINNEGHYQLDNIQIMELIDNIRKGSA